MEARLISDTNPLRHVPPGLIIRGRRPADIEGVTALMGLPGARFGTMALPYETPEALQARSDRQPPGGVFLVAELTGQIVGSASVQPFARRRAHAAGIGMAVHDAYTRQGIGRALLAAIIDTAENWLGIWRLELTVFSDNAPAVTLYESLGFKIEGTHAAYGLRDGRYVDAHAMARLGARGRAGT